MKLINTYIIGVLIMQLSADADMVFSRDYEESRWPVKIEKSEHVNITEGGNITSGSIPVYSDPVMSGPELIVQELSESLDIPVNADIPSKKGLQLAKFTEFIGIRGFSVSSHVNVSRNRVGFRLSNKKSDEYRVMIRSAVSYSQAWKDYLTRYATISLNSNSYALFERTNFDGHFAIMRYSPPGVEYAISTGPYFIEIFVVEKPQTKLDFLNKKTNLDEKLKEFKQHEDNLAHIAREINLILKNKNKMLSEDSPLLTDPLR